MLYFNHKKSCYTLQMIHLHVHVNTFPGSEIFLVLSINLIINVIINGSGHKFYNLFCPLPFSVCTLFPFNRQMMVKMTWRKAHSCWKSMHWRFRCTQLRKTIKNSRWHSTMDFIEFHSVLLSYILNTFYFYYEIYSLNILGKIFKVEI